MNPSTLNDIMRTDAYDIEYTRVLSRNKLRCQMIIDSRFSFNINFDYTTNTYIYFLLFVIIFAECNKLIDLL